MDDIRWFYNAIILMQLNVKKTIILIQFLKTKTQTNFQINEKKRLRLKILD